MTYSAPVLLLAIVSLALIGLPAQAASQSSELGEEERSLATLVLSGMRDSRERIRSGEFVANGVHKRVLPGGKGSFEGELAYRSIFDFHAGIQRFDCKEPSLRGGASAVDSERDDAVTDDSPSSAFDSTFVRTPEWTLRWRRKSMAPITRLGPDEASGGLFKSVDFRIFGLISITGISLGKADFDEVRDYLMGMSPIEVHDHGDGLFELMWVEGKGNHVKKAIWFDQHRGYSPVRIEFWDDRHSTKESIQSGEVVWEEKSAAWVPVTVHLKSSWPVQEEFSLVLNWRNVNGDVNRRLFQPEGLEPPDGTELVSRELGTHILIGKFKGGELDSPESRGAPESSSRGIFLLLGGLPLALILLIVITRRFLERRNGQVTKGAGSLK